MPSLKEHHYTSTGVKFWSHMNQMDSYRNGTGRTVISTHIAPEGACNLKCPYCSVTYRKVSNRISLDVIYDYVTKLKSRGLKAVILTGGGEPTIYPHFNQLVRWLKIDMGLSVALITNGTQSVRVNDDVWPLFSWVRVSINLFDDWYRRIRIPYVLMSDTCVVGSSFVFTLKHEDPQAIDIELLKKVASVARLNGAAYVRLLPNCLLKQTDLVTSHGHLGKLLDEVDDDIFFHQHKLHAAPKCGKCHQSYFRPYLSEVPFSGTKVPGSVYPCDSVVLNNELAQFVDKYQLCKPGDVLDYLDGKIPQQFDATVDCSGCVFTGNVNMLDDWLHDGIMKKVSVPGVMHEEFV